MRESILTRHGTLTKLMVTLLVVALVDLAAATWVFAVHRGDPPVPLFVSTGAEPRPGADAYDPMPRTFGFTTRSLAPQVVAADGRVRLMVRGKESRDPDTSAGYALAALSTYSKTDDPQWLARAERAVADAMTSSRNGVVVNTAPTGDSEEALPDRWVSAKTQGLMLSALTRLASVTDGAQSRRWRAQATAVFDTLLRFRDPVEGHASLAPWFSLLDKNRHIWFEQYPQAKSASRNYTGHLFALTGIYDYTQISKGKRRDAARTLFEAGVSTVDYYFPDIREVNGNAWTSPQRVTRSRPLHDVLKGQLRALTRMTGDARFRVDASALAQDVAVTPFVAAGLRPRGDVDAYAWPDVVGMIPPTSPDETDRVATERAAPRSKVRPDVLLASALTEVARHQATGRRQSLAEAQRLTGRVLDMSRDGLVPHSFKSTNIAGQPLVEPWYSAQTQGLLLSTLVRLEAATGKQRWADAADAVFETLQRSRNTPRHSVTEPPPIWMSYVGDPTGEHVWFDKYVKQNSDDIYNQPSMVVDAHIAAVIGIYDYWRMTKRPAAAHLFDGGVSTVVDAFPAMRRQGKVSLTAVHWRVYRLDHHRVVTRQLAVLSRMTGEPSLAEFSRHLAQDAS